MTSVRGLAFSTASFIFAAAAPVDAQPERAVTAAKLTLDRSLEDWRREPSASGFVASTQVSNPGGSAGLWLYLDQIDRGDETPFELTFIGPGGPLQTIGSDELAVQDSFSTATFDVQELTVELRADREPHGLELRIRDLLFEVEGATPFAHVGGNQLQRVAFLAQADPHRRRGGAVAKITFLDGGSCTGFLIGPDQLLTNHHCIGTSSDCTRHTKVQFGYLLHGGQRWEARCQELLVADEDRDMALVRLDRRAGDTWGTLALAAVGPASGRGLYVLQHPDGRPQEVSVQGCAVREPSRAGVHVSAVFSHSCDTEGGSSGSPVLDAQTHEVVGLHSCCSPLPSHAANEAIPVQRVREKLPPS